MSYSPAPRPDRPETIADAEADAEARDFKLDKVGQWRFDRLVAAGYTETQSLWLALDRTVDLHKAVDLAAKAGAHQAFQIIN